MRRTIRTAAALAALGLGAAVGGAACFSPSELVLVINTSMAPGEDIDQLRIKVNGEETPYTLDPKKDGSILLPATLGFLPADAKPDEPFTIEVTAFKGGKKRSSVGPFSLKIEDVGPTFFPVDIPFLCADEACEAGESCVNGLCISPDCGGDTCKSGETCVKGACKKVSLPAAPYPEEGLFADELCVDVVGCFERGSLAAIDPATCTIAAPNDREMNVALITAAREIGARGAGTCNGNACFLPLDDVPRPKDGRIQLPPGVCVQIVKGRVLGVTATPITGDCPRKTVLTSVNRASSSIASCKSAPVKDLAQPWLIAGEVKKTRIKHTETLLPYSDGTFQLLVTGGFRRTVDDDPATLTALDSVEVFSTAASTDPWVEKSPMRYFRAGHTATLIPDDGIVLVAGGVDGLNDANTSVDVFNVGDGPSDPLQGWEPKDAYPPMNQGRFGHTATLVTANRNVVLTGGLTGEDAVTNTTEIFDSTGKTFFLNPPVMSTPRVGHSATPLLDGRILVVGGAAQKTGDGFDGFVTAVEAYDKDLGGSGGFSVLPPLEPARMLHAALRLEKGDANGLVMVTGGANGEGGSGLTPLAVVHFFDPSVPSWTCAARPMNVARFGHSATELADGRVLVVGGVTSLGTSAPAEIFEPGDPVENGTWTIVGVPQGVPRVGHTATLLPEDSGGVQSVLLVGGGTIDPGALTPSVDLGSFESLLLGVQETPTFTYSSSLSGAPPTSQNGCGGAGGDGGGGGKAPEASEPVDFAGSGCASDPGVKRTGCGVNPSFGADGAPWALALLAFLARRRRRVA